MPAGNESLPSIEAWKKREQIIEAFEKAWQKEPGPAFDGYLPPAGADRLDILMDLVQVDLEHRLQRGEPARVETYLQQYQELVAHSNVVSLLLAEYALRSPEEPGLAAAEYLERFPQYGPEFLRQFFAVYLRTRARNTGKSTRWGAETIEAGSHQSSGEPTHQSVSEPRYHSLRFHAKGGLGEVFLAHDAELHRDVALKRIQEPRARDPESRRRFLLEAEITARLEHPGVVPVHGLAQDESGQPSYAMRFVQGETLQEAIHRFHATDQPARKPGERSLALRQLLTRFIAVCNTVAYAHSRGILHRDLKPANIMLGKYGETLVLDWGLAKSFEPDNAAGEAGEKTLPTGPASGEKGTQTGEVIGTPAFMSPEQAAGRWNAVGPASDIYSLGATLYALLTGQPPFQGLNLLDRVRQGKFPPPRQVKKRVPRALEAICQKAMALQPEDRYSTALELAEEVEDWLADEPVAAHREPWLPRLGRWGRRHRPVVAGGAALLLTAVVALAAGLFFVNAEKERTELARKGEETQRIEAQQRNAETSAVLDFVEKKVFAAARPKDKEGGQGYDVKLADAVKAALPFVDKSFTGQPLIEARLRMTMGLSFLYLSDTKTAIEQFQAARELYTEHRGPDHPNTLHSMHNLATSYDAAGRTQEALKLCEETLQLRKAKLGPDHPDTLATMNNLGSSYYAAGRTQEALKLFEETLQLTKAKLGPHHPDTLGSMVNLANSYYAAGRTQEAIELYEETLPLMKTKLGPDDPDTLHGMNNLAASYLAAGRTQEALKLFEETLKLRKAKLGPDHLETLMSMNNLANSYDAAGRSQQALELRQKTLQLKKAKLGPDHPETLTSMNNLALSYIAVGEVAKAVAILRDTLSLRERRVMAEPGNSLEQSLLALTHGQIGEVEQARLDYAAAVQAYARSVEMFAKLDQAGALKHPFFRERSNFYHQRLAPCRKAEQAVKDLDFALQQPAAEVPGLLDMRVRFLLKEQKLPAAVESAAKMKELAGDKAEQLYNAACAYALCAGAAKQAKSPVANAPGSDKLAEEALALLKQAAAKGYKDVAHMKKDPDLDSLREREDFQKLLAQLEGKASKGGN